LFSDFVGIIVLTVLESTNLIFNKIFPLFFLLLFNKSKDFSTDSLILFNNNETNETVTSPINLSFVIGDSIKHRDRLARMVAGGAIDPTFVIDGRVRLDQAVEAYAALKAQQYMKIIIDLG
jgi:threonine dehydrogenase-like Zn-dependent dehydrogenase